MSKIFTLETRPYDDRKLFNRKKIEINEGITVLVGCNGAGKSTVLQYIREQLRRDNIPFLSYDNISDGGQHFASKALFGNNIELAAGAMVASEGERVNMAIGMFIKDLGRFVSKTRNTKELWILFDAADSGYSIDNIAELKEFIHEVLIPDNEEKKLYIVFSGNQYELAEGEDCIAVQTGKHMTFASYEDYRKFILESRKRKDASFDD